MHVYLTAFITLLLSLNCLATEGLDPNQELRQHSEEFRKELIKLNDSRKLPPI
jgi:hypothetical protein